MTNEPTGKMSRWQYATGRNNTHVTRGAAEKQAEVLRKRNPRRQFRVSKVNGPRGGEYYMVFVYLTDAEYKRRY